MSKFFSLKLVEKLVMCEIKDDKIFCPGVDCCELLGSKQFRFSVILVAPKISSNWNCHWPRLLVALH